MKKVLFVCVHNSGRSQIAEAFFNHMAYGIAQGMSAGTQPVTDINPMALEAMAEIGIDMSHQKPKLLTPELTSQVERVITMGCGAESLCPATFLPTEDWGLEDPAGQPIEKVHQIRDQIKMKVQKLIDEMREGR